MRNVRPTLVNFLRPHMLVKISVKVKPPGINMLPHAKRPGGSGEEKADHTPDAQAIPVNIPYIKVMHRPQRLMAQRVVTSKFL